jgi:hypothetical protein
MSLAKLLAGRKRENGVWDFFEYDETKKKSVCMAKVSDDGKTCGLQLAGKNPTNLKVRTL